MPPLLWNVLNRWSPLNKPNKGRHERRAQPLFGDQGGYVKGKTVVLQRPSPTVAQMVTLMIEERCERMISRGRAKSCKMDMYLAGGVGIEPIPVQASQGSQPWT